MELRLSDPSYMDRLASFLRSLGQPVLVSAPDGVDVGVAPTRTVRDELEIYLRVWKVLYPDADVQMSADGDGLEA